MIRRPPRSTLFPYHDALPLSTGDRFRRLQPFVHGPIDLGRPGKGSIPLFGGVQIQPTQYHHGDQQQRNSTANEDFGRCPGAEEPPVGDRRFVHVRRRIDVGNPRQGGSASGEKLYAVVKANSPSICQDDGCRSSDDGGIGSSPCSSNPCIMSSS